MTEQLFNDQTLGGKVPLVSLARNDGDFSEKGKYWRGSLRISTAYATLKINGISHQISAGENTIRI